jgi:N6-adenosine-specific RNA methylase IME4
MSLSPFYGLPLRHYGAILADPPWSYLTWGGDQTVPHRTEEAPYTTMMTDELKSLPVASLAKDDCVLFLWTISSNLEQAFPLANAWGFQYKAKVFEWFKRTNDGKSFRMGMGKWSRQETETCLLFTRGKPKRLSGGVRQVIESVPRGHSRKPDEQYDRIRKLVAGPYLELFAKYRKVGWSGWGNEYPDALEQARDQNTAARNRVMGLCEKGHGSFKDYWPLCDETCIPF